MSFTAASYPCASLAATRNVPGQYETIQAAIDAAVPGDTVLIAPGTYRGPGNRGIVLRGKDVAVLGRDGSDNTIIDCERADRGFCIREWETRDARVEGLTITGGQAISGGGMYCAISSPAIVRCRFVDNWASQDGGGLTLVCSDALVEECIFEKNLSQNFAGGLGAECGAPLIQNCVITGNWGYRGGGVWLGGTGENVLHGCTIADNLGSLGGGLRSDGAFTLDRCIVWGNCAVIHGAQIYQGHGTLQCSVVDSSGVYSPSHAITYDENCRFVDPSFCDPAGCGYTDTGEYTLESGSVCLPENSPCGTLIGALGEGCGGTPAMGACCFADGSCEVRTIDECLIQQGSYQGDDTLCTPDLCQPTPVEQTSWGRIKQRFR